MRVLSLVWGCLALCGVAVGLIPFLGWLNWLLIPFSLVGLLIGALALVVSKEKERVAFAVVGLCFSFLAVLIGFVRLVLGHGIL